MATLEFQRYDLERGHYDSDPNYMAESDVGEWVKFDDIEPFLQVASGQANRFVYLPCMAAFSPGLPERELFKVSVRGQQLSSDEARSLAVAIAEALKNKRGIDLEY